MNTTRDWSQWLPPFDPQHSANNVADADDCVSESAVHIIETLIYQQTGKQVRYSPRALAKLAGTTLNGNDINTVMNAVKKYGLIPYELWPDLTNFTWDEYYADIPQNVIDAGKDFLAEWDISNITTTADLSVAPIWLRVKAGSTFHFVEQFNATEIFDSYLPAIKPITTYEPVNSFQFTIKQKQQMTNSFFVFDPVKNEFAIAAPATNPDGLISAALNSGLTLPMKQGVPDTAPAADRIDFESLKTSARILQ
jgi:hypothetical protein